MATNPRQRFAQLRRSTMPKWSKAFLAELAVTSNVTASAKAAKVSTTTVYDVRRTNPEFNRQWQQALCEGYDHLELELLFRLRSGEIKRAVGAKTGVRSYDNATTFRLLAAHRESAARQRAVRDSEDTEAVLVSIDAQLELMRQRKLAARKDGNGGK